MERSTWIESGDRSVTTRTAVSTYCPHGLAAGWQALPPCYLLLSGHADHLCHHTACHRIAEQVPVPLLPTTSGRGAVVGLWLGPEPHHRHARAVTLRLRLEQWTFVDRIEVWWDGHTLTTPAPPAATAAVGTIMTSHVQWLRFVLSGQQQQQQLALDEGIHRVEIILHHRNPQVLSEILLTDVEVLFDYGAPPTCGAAITAKL